MTFQLLVTVMAARRQRIAKSCADMCCHCHWHSRLRRTCWQ